MSKRLDKKKRATEKKRRKERERSTAKKKRPLSSDETALFDRVFIGLGSVYPRGAKPFDGELYYVLNPEIRGEKELIIHEARTYPAFVVLHCRCDELACEKIGVDRSVLLPFWLGRFIVFTEQDVLFGYVSMRDAHWNMHVLGFDYALISEAYGDDFAEYAASVPASARLPRVQAAEFLNFALELVAKNTNAKCTYHEMQGIDPGVGSFAYESKGGDA